MARNLYNRVLRSPSALLGLLVVALLLGSGLAGLEASAAHDSGSLPLSPAQIGGPLPVDFNETGLMTGTSWSVYVNSEADQGNETQSSTGTTVSFFLAAGTYNYSMLEVSGYRAVVNATGDFTLVANGTTVNVTWVAVSYPVWFNETGLPSGTDWSVTLNGTVNSSTSDSIGFEESDGTYLYAITDVPGWHQTTLPYTGTVSVSGTPVAEPTLEFIQVNYSVSFTESGLPGGATWYANFTSGPSGFSLPEGSAAAGSAISVNLVNGTYTYTVTTNNRSYTATGIPPLTESGGTPSIVPVVFSPQTYTVKFTESGLPSSVPWWVNVTGNPPANSTTPSLSLSEPNGTYAYTVRTGEKTYAPSPGGGSFTVNGADVFPPAITFKLVTYAVVFTQAGLPSGTLWYVNVTRGLSASSTTTSLSISEPNGTYDYTVATVYKEYAPMPASGRFIVKGTSVPESVTFALFEYSVTFTEMGLPPRTSWSVTLGGTLDSSTTSTITFQEPNGTHAYTIGTVAGWQQQTLPYRGNITVLGEPSSEPPLVFTKANYTVTFTESGLPVGTEWWVNLTDGQSFNSTSTTLTFLEANGTYDYHIPSVPGYTVNQPKGTITVSASPVVVNTVWVRLYRVSFVETGLPSHTFWEVNLSGVEHSTTTDALGYTETNGTWNYTVIPVPDSSRIRPREG